MAYSINDEVVAQGRIEEEANRMRAQYYQAMQEQQSEMSAEEIEAQLQDWAKDNVIEEILLRQNAAKRIAEVAEEEIQAALEQIQFRFGGPEGLAEFKEKEPEMFASLREDIVARIKVDKLRVQLTERAARPKQSEVAEYYVKHKDEFTTPELVHAMHIVKHTGAHTGTMVTEGQALTAIGDVKKELDSGRAFEEVANEHSDCGGNGGDLGWFPRGQMVESFEDVVFAMQPGDVSGIFKTEFGYHIAKVIERRPESVRPLSDVKDAIADHLLEAKKTKMIENFLDQQRERAKVEEVPDPEEAESSESVAEPAPENA